jgi:hypothetical protein
LLLPFLLPIFNPPDKAAGGKKQHGIMIPELSLGELLRPNYNYNLKILKISETYSITFRVPLRIYNEITEDAYNMVITDLKDFAIK